MTHRTELIERNADVRVADGAMTQQHAANDSQLTEPELRQLTLSLASGGMDDNEIALRLEVHVDDVRRWLSERFTGA
jgi:hypothetical protein